MGICKSSGSQRRKDGTERCFHCQYFKAKENVNLLKKEFGEKIKVDLVVKNIDGTDFSYRENIEIIDSYIPERYTKNTLEKPLEKLII